MRKLLLFLLIIGLSVPGVWAERIDEGTARKVAAAVAAQSREGLDLRSTGALSFVYAAAPGEGEISLRSEVPSEEADYFVYNFSGNKGFVIVAGEDRVRPVLGYAHQGAFHPDRLPEGLRRMLAGYQEEIKRVVQSDVEASVDVQEEWSRYLEGTTLNSGVGEVVLKTAEWSQDAPYNLFTPTVNIQGKAEHCPTGCVATATAIIMKYHRYPARISGTGVKEYEGMPVTYADYVWENMPDLYFNKQTWTPSYTPEQGEAVAALMWNLGANLETKYGLASSGSVFNVAAGVLNDLMGYDESIRTISNLDFRLSDWKKMIRHEIDAARPVLMAGMQTDGEGDRYGHAFVCSGYNAQEHFYLNWGWGDDANGFYVLHAADPGILSFYPEENVMVVGIQPKNGTNEVYKDLRFRTLSVSETPLVVGTPFSILAEITNVGNLAFGAKVDLAVFDASGVIKKRLCGDRADFSFPFHEKGRQGLGLRIAFQGMLTAPLEEGDRILPVYSTDGGATWKVMEGGLNAPLYINQTGVVFGNESPTEPVVKPTVVRIDERMQTDRTYMKVSVLDNSVDSWSNLKNYFFSVENLKEDESLRFRFTLKDFARWKDHFSVYYNDGKEDGFQEAGRGRKIDVKEGVFFIDVQDKDLEWNRPKIDLKLFADISGELSFDVAVFSSKDHYAYALDEVKDKVMVFVKELRVSLSPDPIHAQVNTKASFVCTVNQVDPLVRDKQMDVRLIFKNDNAETGIQPADLNLFMVKENGEEVAIPIPTSGMLTTEFQSDLIPLGYLTDGTSWTFRVSSKKEVLPEDRFTVCFGADFSEIHQGEKYSFRIPCILPCVNLSFGPENVGIESVVAADVKVWGEKGRLHIVTTQPEQVQVVSFDGRVLDAFIAPVGESSRQMEPGSFLIRVDEHTYKIRF